jgi:SAM-dependent methyltransferase
MLEYTKETIRRAEAAATGPDALRDCLSILRTLPLDDFGMIMISMPSADLPRLSGLLPAMASAEVQRSWTGADGPTLLSLTDSFVRILAHNFHELCGRPISEARILDFGCGYGRMLRSMYYYSDPARIFGCDPWDESIKLCRQARIPSPLAISDYLPNSLPFDGEFDLIYAFSVFTHLSKAAMNAALATLRKQLTDDGLLVITTRPVEYWFADKNINEAEAQQLADLHSRTGFAFKPHNRPAVDGDITYGDASMTLDYLERYAPAFRIVKVERTLQDWLQLIVFLQPRK